jgi:hypothetical protein
MRKIIVTVTGPALLLGALLACGVATEARADVRVGVGINLGPPPIVVAEPPAVVLVPGSQVYFVPGLEFDVFFSNGYWWSPRGDRWYRARAYNGPWRTVERRFVPRSVIHVPHDYRRAYGRERHIPYREWREHRGRGRHHERERHEMRERRERREEFRERGEHREREDRGEHGHGHER